MEMDERILRGRQHAGLRTKVAAARLLDVSPSALGRWELPLEHPNSTYPTVEHLLAMAKLFGVAFEWLATGRGTMCGATAVGSDVDAEWSEFSSRYQQLSGEQRSVLDRLIEQLLGSRELSQGGGV